MLQTLPSTLSVLGIGLFEARRGVDMAVFEIRRVFVTFPVQRNQNGFVEFGAFFEHRLGGF